jgi:hypothetical protein
MKINIFKYEDKLFQINVIINYYVKKQLDLLILFNLTYNNFCSYQIFVKNIVTIYCRSTLIKHVDKTFFSNM